jgi:predicted regulator of Ras-like GTPase activity (Roadblock/LC7/MglB family)
MNEDVDALVRQLEPYRRRPGIAAALLISRDGFLVAKLADDSFNAEAVAAQLGATIDIGARLAGELGQPATRFITFELSGLNAVLSPFNEDLLLALVGTPDAIGLSYTLRGGPA